MSKKSYKQLQNRLYREIKRRIVAEQQISMPIKFTACDRKIDTFKAEYRIPSWFATREEYLKMEVVRRIVIKLYEEGYFEFHWHGQENDFPIGDYSWIDARLHVVRPWREWGDETSEPQSAT